MTIRSSLLRLSALSCLALLLFSTASLADDRFENCRQYEPEIAAATRRHWGGYNHPEALEAQLYQESLCDPFAISPVGAKGIAQFMPATWAEQSARLGIRGKTPFDKAAIRASAAYTARLWRIWRSERPQDERWRLGLASYNAGAGNIIKAQRACSGERDWGDISPCLPQITGDRNAHETTTYVAAIDRWRGELESEPLQDDNFWPFW
ncbi:MAG: hypothetical protein COA84_12805 [Robiginitomaculum sp.]|nr:MAG: hypothetical protein COA84_12805 [Robiginitomaculum sp.]